MNELQQFLATLDAEAKSEWVKIEAAAVHFATQAAQAIEIGLQALAPIALNAVLNAATKAVSGGEKFGSAVTDVIQQVEGQGMTVATQTAQMVVQQAYLTVQSLVGQQGQ